MASKMKIRPLGDRVLVEALEPAGTTSKGGLIIPDTVSKERPQEGRVVAVGPGRHDDGVLVPISVKKGDHILFSKYGPDEIKVDGKDYYILSEANILAVIED